MIRQLEWERTEALQQSQHKDIEVQCMHFIHMNLYIMAVTEPLTIICTRDYSMV